MTDIVDCLEVSIVDAGMGALLKLFSLLKALNSTNYFFADFLSRDM